MFVDPSTKRGGSDVMRVTIVGRSSFGKVKDTYTERLVLTPQAITYNMKPTTDGGIAPAQWGYRSARSHFLKAYRAIVTLLPELMDAADQGSSRPGFTTITVTFRDRTSKTRNFLGIPNELDHVYALIRKLVPENEPEPRFLGGEAAREQDALLAAVEAAEVEDAEN